MTDTDTCRDATRHASDPSCVFCKIVAGELPSKPVLDEPDIYAFHDIHPAAPAHVLVIPKVHIASLAHATSKDAPLLGKCLDGARRVAAVLGLDAGYRTVINTGAHGGQTVHHLHIHVLGRKQHGWPPG
jgi:histidine triad (HIT) family protein